MEPKGIGPDTWVRRDPNRVSTRLGEEVILLDFPSDSYLKLNEVGARIWDLLEHPIRVQDLFETLLREYQVDSTQLEQDLHRFLREMLQRGLVHVVKKP